MPEPERIDRRRAALIAYDVCRRALTPSDPGAANGDAPGARCLGADDRGRAGGGRAGDLHDAGQPRRWRRCRHAADRPFGGDRRAAADQRHRGHGRGRLPRRDRAAARGLRLPQAPAERLLRHGRRRAAAHAAARHRSSSAAAPPIAASRRASARPSTSTSRRSWCANAAGAAMRPPTPTASTRR